MLKRKLNLLVISAISTSLLIPAMSSAGNVKKLYVNVSKEGQQAQASDIPANYASVANQNAATVYDFGHDAHGIYVGTDISKVSGKFGNALRFGTTERTGVKLPDNSMFSTLNDFTFEAWIKGDGVGFSNSPTNRLNGWGSIVGFGVSGESPLWGPVAGKMGIYFTGPSIGGTTTNTTSNTALPLNQWVHVAVTRQGSQIQFYLNGKPDGAPRTLSVLGTTAINTRTHPFRGLGYDAYWNITEDFVGDMDEVRIWNVVRTPQEIEQFYNKTLPYDSLSKGLVGYWTFDN